LPRQPHIATANTHSNAGVLRVIGRDSIDDLRCVIVESLVIGD